MALLGLGGCAYLPFFGEKPEETSEEELVPEAPLGGPGLAYEAEIVGVADDDLRDLLTSASQLIGLQDRSPSTFTAIERRAERDLDRLQVALRSEGYYDGEVRYEVDRETEPIEIRIFVAPGPLYRLAEYDVRYEGDAPPPAGARPSLEDLGLQLGMAARGPAVVEAQQALLRHIGNRGYPLAQVVDRKTLVSHEDRSMTVRLRVDPGPFARFGPLSVTGLTAVEEDYVRDIVAWPEGETFEQEQIARARTTLLDTGLFTLIRIDPATSVTAEGELPVGLVVEEAKHRSIGFGAGYSTSEGFSGEVFWEHRNLFDRNEQLRLSLTAAEIEQSLEADFRKPNFIYPDHVLLARAGVANRDTEAFQEESIAGFVGVERPWAENWLLTGGVSAEYTILDDEEGEREFQLLGLPLTGTRDGTDDLLDPTRGTRLNLSLTPYAGTGDETLAFVVASAGGSAYYALDDEARYVLAGRVRIGSLAGEDTETIPANKRFYAGGGGSIRGYEFQSVGPLDAEDDPLGGRSLFEVSGEVRIRVTESIGVVPFIDGGTVFDSPYPDFDETLRWAAGLGVRYFTALGPVRLDVAVPLNKREGVDDDFQFYISLGQAF